MKRLLSFFAIVTFFLFIATASDDKQIWQDGFIVEATGDFVLNAEHYPDDYIASDFYKQRPFSLSIGAGYQWFIKQGIYVQTSVSLYYGKLKHDYPLVDGGNSHTFEGVSLPKFKEFGFGASTFVGYAIPVKTSNSLSIFTGPKISYALHMNESFDGLKNELTCCYHKRLMWKWCFGVQFNLLKHYYVKSSFNLSLTRQKSELYLRKLNRLEFGIGYKFLPIKTTLTNHAFSAKAIMPL